jgi:anti-sigma B factor antagonist
LRSRRPASSLRVQAPVKQSAVFFLVREVAMTNVRADDPSRATGPGADPGDPFATRLTTSVAVRGDAVVVHVAGEIDEVTAAEFQEAVARALGGRLVVVVLAGVTFLGSAGLAALLGIRDDAATLGTVVRFVVGGNRMVLRPLTITGVADVLDLHDDVEQALREPTPGQA